MVIDFSIQTKPVPQARLRFFVKQKGLKRFVGAYDPVKCKSFKEVVAWHAKIKAVEQGLISPLANNWHISLI